MDKIKSALLKVYDKLTLNSDSRVTCLNMVKFVSKFETVIMNSLWLKLLTQMYKVNLIIEARNTTLDIEQKNISDLIVYIKNITWDEIVTQSKRQAVSFSIEIAFESTRTRKHNNSISPWNHFENVFHKIIDTLVKSLEQRFAFVKDICDQFGVLWRFRELSDYAINEASIELQQKYNTEISPELSEEILLLRSMQISTQIVHSSY